MEQADTATHREAKVAKILNREHPDVSVHQLKHSLAMLADPVLVLRSGTERDAVVAVFDELDENGDPLVAAIHCNSGDVDFHKLASLYGKEVTPANPKHPGLQVWLDRAFDAGDVLYMNENRAAALAAGIGVSIPSGQQVREAALDALPDVTRSGSLQNRNHNGNMLLEADLIKARTALPQLYQSHLSQFAKTDTEDPSFKAWFGDSKVTDSSGTPLRLYHGTQRDFEAHQASRTGKVDIGLGAVEIDRHGMFFTDDPAFASGFAQQGDAGGRNGGNVQPIYLSIKNPFIADEAGPKNEDAERLAAVGVDAHWIANYLGDPRSTWEAFDGEDGKWFVDKLREAGYDGFQMREYDTETKQTHNVWVAFEPTQIKSIFNRGTFDRNDPRILYQSASQAGGIEALAARGFDTSRVFYHQTAKGNVESIISTGFDLSKGRARLSDEGVPERADAPYPLGPDQKDGIQFCCTRFGSIVADEMGVGKTAEAIGVINVEQPRLALILVPANLMVNWSKECKSYMTAPNVVAMFGKAKQRDHLPMGTNVIIASYDMLPRLEILHDLKVDILICDEGQEIKSEETKAGRIIYERLVPNAGKFIWMSGTPVWNRPQDLWAPLHACAPDVFPYKKNFMRLFRVNDPENLTEEQEARLDFLAHVLKSGLMIRRLKDDVLDLPPKVHHIINVNLPPDVLARLQERDRKVEEVKEEAEKTTGKQKAAKQATLFSEIARLRREVGEAKMDAVRDYVINFMHEHANDNRPRPPLVFGRHRELLRRFGEHIHQRTGTSTEILTGEATPTARQKRVDNFQEGRSGAAVAGFDAAGVGYTMIRSCDVFMFEIDYTPSLMKQAIDRTHRRGQDREVNIYWFVVDGTIDARIAKLFVSKDEVAQHALGDHLVGMFEPADLFGHSVIRSIGLAA